MERNGLATDNDLIDAALGETIAADSEQPRDTAVLVDDVVDTEPEVTVDVAPEADTFEAEVDAPRAPFCDPTDADLIACYRFEVDEYATQPRDESMYGHHGTATAVTFGAGPPGAGKAIQIAPTSLVKVPYAPTLGVTSAITIEAWIRAKTIPATGRAGILDDNGRYGFFIMPGGILRATAPMIIDSPAIITAGTWLHVAYTYDGSKQILYVSGLIVKTQDLIGGTYGMSDGAGLAIGMNSPSGDNFDGAIDSVRIFKIARSAKQICEAAGKSPC